VTRIVLDIDDSQWKVGHLARVMRTAESEFLSELAAQVEIQVTSARPLIVLDLTDHNPAVLVDVLACNGYGELADQIEAQTKPARIPEPGLWGVVEATLEDSLSIAPGTFRFVRIHTGPRHWMRTETTVCFDWSELIDPTLIRKGLS